MIASQRLVIFWGEPDDGDAVPVSLEEMGDVVEEMGEIVEEMGAE